MLLLFHCLPVLDIAHIYFYTWAALFEGQLHPSTAQYDSGRRWIQFLLKGT